MLDVKKLALLREVAIHGGITGAARALHTSPSNVSQQLNRLENEYGVALLEPSGRGVKLTLAAERLVASTEEILATLEEAETELRESTAARGGLVRLAAFHTFAVGLLGATARELKRSEPSLTLSFTQLDPEAAFEEVLARRADLAVVDEYEGFTLPPASGLVRVTVGDEPIFAVMPEGKEDPRSVDWAMEPPQSDAFRWARNVCRSAGFEPTVRYESPDPYVHRRLIEEGLAAAFLPATVAVGLIGGSSGAQRCRQISTNLSRTYVLTMRRGTERSRALLACQEAVHAAFRDVVGRAAGSTA